MQFLKDILCYKIKIGIYEKFAKSNGDFRKKLHIDETLRHKRRHSTAGCKFFLRGLAIHIYSIYIYNSMGLAAQLGYFGLVRRKM